MKKVLFIAAISFTLLSSCKETNKKKPIETQNTETTLSKEELQQKQDSIEAVKKENRILDSLQQVKSHGHAH
jgi:cell shape-determining protein MreC